MGQRHQLFVIARVRGRYRCVAAFHSQWLYGRLVVHAAARLMRAFSNQFNAAAISTELSTLKDSDFEDIDDDVDHENPTVLCPYLTGLFMTSCRVDMDRFQLYRLSLIPVDVLPSACNNDDGYTCFDLTEPAEPRYCFWSWPGRGPVKAQGYLDQNTQVDPAVLELLDHYYLVDTAALAAVWPEDFVSLSAAVRESQVDEISPAPPTSLSALSVVSAVRSLLSSDDLDSDDAMVSLENLIVEQNHLTVLRTEFLAVSKLNANGIFLLKQLLLAENASFVDMKPWLSTGAIDAMPLLGLLDALQHAESLDLSTCSTLTENILESLVLRLPNLKNVVALACPQLGPLTKALPLSVYLATPPLLAAVQQTRIQEGNVISAPECIRWTDAGDPPAGLAIVLFAPPLGYTEFKPGALNTRRFGVELAHFGAEAVVRGFMKLAEHLYDPDAWLDPAGFFFEMRAYFHPVGAASVAPVAGAGTLSYSYGALPSLIPSISLNDADGTLAGLASTQAAMAGVPRHPGGWALVLNTKGTMPTHRYFRPPQPEAAVSVPDYAFQRWDYVPGPESVGLQPVEALSVREWVGRLPGSHGRVPEALLSECEAVLARLNVGVRSLPLA